MKRIYTKCSTIEESTELSRFIMCRGYGGVYNDSSRYNDVAREAAYNRNISHHNECIFVGVNGCQLVIEATKRQMRKHGSLHYIRKERVFKELLEKY